MVLIVNNNLIRKKKIYKSFYFKIFLVRVHKIWDLIWFCCGVYIDLMNIVLLCEGLIWSGVYVIFVGVVKLIFVMLYIVK